MIAQFDNGIERRVFKVPVATFANPDGLARGPAMLSGDRRIPASVCP